MRVLGVEREFVSAGECPPPDMIRVEGTGKCLRVVWNADFGFDFRRHDEFVTGYRTEQVELINMY